MKHESTAAVQHHTVIQPIAISYEHLPSKSDEQPDRKKGPTSPINLPLAPAIRKNWKMENTPPTHPNPKPNSQTKEAHTTRKQTIQDGRINGWLPAEANGGGGGWGTRRRMETRDEAVGRRGGDSRPARGRDAGLGCAGGWGPLRVFGSRKGLSKGPNIFL